MTIQSVAAYVTIKPEERIAQAVEQPGTVAATGRRPAVDGATTAANAAPPSRKDVADAVGKINESMLGAAQGLEFSIDEDTKDIVVKVIDQNTGDVVRQMPSKEALDIAKSLDKMRGLLIDHSA